MKPQKSRKASDFPSSMVWGELAIISSSGVEKNCMLLKKDEYTIGRSRRCDVRIAIKTVSRTHVSIKRMPSTQKIILNNCSSGEEDLFVNRNLIKSGESVDLTFGDVIMLSRKVFKLYSPREEQSVVQNDTVLCSVRGSKCLQQSEKVNETKGGITRSAQKRKASSLSCPRAKRCKSLEANVSNDLALGTPEALNKKSFSGSIGLSDLKQIKADKIQVLSPAAERRKLTDRKSMSPLSRSLGSGQLSKKLCRYHSAKKRLSEGKQILKTKVIASKNNLSECGKQKILFTPSLKTKTEEQRRQEIMAALLASSSPKFGTVNEQLKSHCKT